MDKNTITFIARYDYTLRRFIDQCYELGIPEDFHIEGRTVKQLSYQPIQERSLVVLSSLVVQPIVEAYLPAETKVIVAKRTINFMNIRGMLELPRSTKVLLVSDRKERALETVSLLRNLGLELDFEPYWPEGVCPPDITVAVTPGESQHVPKAIRKVVDIGSRIIDLSTWIEIYAYFNYEGHDLSHLTARYVQSIVYITKQLSTEIHKTNMLRNHLEAVIERIEDAVLAIDDEGFIRMSNPKLQDILHLRSVHVVNQLARDCLPDSFYKLVSQLPYDKEEVVQLNNQHVFLRKVHIKIDGQSYGQMLLFRKAAEIHKLELDYRRQLLSKGHIAKYSFHDFSGHSAEFLKVLSIAEKIAKSDSTVLLLGETGTGKELLAQAIHNASPRKWEPFVGVNFAAISESLLESELFGYEEGAFTGARKGGRIGLFEQAHKGTIFLDEIGDASLNIQNRLLRVLQEKEIMKVGGNRVIPVDFRVIAATNQNLPEMIKEGRFRSDLYFRLHVLPIHIPPLRHRREDIPVLTNMFVEKISNKLKRPVFSFSGPAMAAMMSYEWPGNIRELENAIEYLAHVVEYTVEPHHLLFNLGEHGEEEVTSAGDAAAENDAELRELFNKYERKGYLREVLSILRIIEQSGAGVGRSFINDIMRQQGDVATDQQIRYRLKMLKEDGLLTVGRGRQGSVLSEAGLSFVRLFD